MRTLLFCAILSWPKQLPKNIKVRLSPKNLILFPPGKKLQCIFNAFLEIFEHFELYWNAIVRLLCEKNGGKVICHYIGNGRRQCFTFCIWRFFHLEYCILYCTVGELLASLAGFLASCLAEPDTIVSCDTPPPPPHLVHNFTSRRNYFKLFISLLCVT